MTPESERGDMTPPEVPIPGRKAIGPDRELLAKQARVLLFQRINDESHRPFAYYDDAIYDLWKPRRQVCLCGIHTMHSGHCAHNTCIYKLYIYDTCNDDRTNRAHDAHT